MVSGFQLPQIFLQRRCLLLPGTRKAAQALNESRSGNGGVRFGYLYGFGRIYSEDKGCTGAGKANPVTFIQLVFFFTDIPLINKGAVGSPQVTQDIASFGLGNLSVAALYRRLVHH